MKFTSINNKKGFSLAELVVVLALIVIVFACLIGLVSLINDNIKTNKENNAILTEIDSAKDFVEDWFNNYDDDSYYVYSVESNKITIKNISNEEFYLQANNDNLETSTNLTKAFAKINNVSFTQNATTGLIKCTFNYSNNLTFNFVLNKNS